MSKKIILAGIALFSFIIPSLLLTGCPMHTDSLYGVKVTSDGNGGAFAVYEEGLGRLIYAQKISPDGKTMWGEEGVLGTNPDSKSYAFPSIEIAGDSAEGVVTAWWTALVGNQRVPVYHVSKLDSEGNRLWQKDVGPVDQLLSDGAGGVILDCATVKNTILVNRIDSSGDFPWGENGISLARPGNYRQIASDGLGGAIIVREELRYPEGAQPGETFSNGYIYVQKIDSQGQFSWGEEGMLLYSTPEDAYAESPQIISDGSGGAIIAWHQQPRGRIESGSAEALGMDIFVQKVDAKGNIIWREGGLPLEINKAAAGAFPIEPRLVSDGSGGAIITWRDSRDDIGIYAQKVDADGTISWQAGGVKVASTSLNPHRMIVTDGAGGAIVSYSLEEGLYVQRLNGGGQTLWLDNGIQVTDGEYQGYSIAPDGHGGLIVGWGIGKGLFSSEKAYVQRVSADGKLMWDEDGVRLNP